LCGDEILGLGVVKVHAYINDMCAERDALSERGENVQNECEYDVISLGICVPRVNREGIVRDVVHVIEYLKELDQTDDVSDYKHSHRCVHRESTGFDQVCSGEGWDRKEGCVVSGESDEVEVEPRLRGCHFAKVEKAEENCEEEDCDSASVEGPSCLCAMLESFLESAERRGCMSLECL